MTLKSFLRSSSAPALLASALFTSPFLADAAPKQEISVDFDGERAVTAELQQLRTQVRQLNSDADQLSSLGFQRLHWETHADQLNQIRDHVNRIGDQLAVLDSLRTFSAPWQQDALDDLMPIAIEVANRTAAAIHHLKENHQYLWAPRYVDHLRTIANRSDEMDDLLDNHLKLMEAQD